MLLAALVMTLAQTAAAPPSIDGATAVALGPGTATAQMCLGEADFAQAQTAPKSSAEWRRGLESAAAFFKRALALPGLDALHESAIERLLVIFDSPLLDNAEEMLAAFGQLIALEPAEVEPLFRYAAYQERRGSTEAAEETLLSARRLQPEAIEPCRKLAQFYARRATALHAAAHPPEAGEATPPGRPDKDGVYQVGETLQAPRRMGNAVYPPDATAAGIAGAVVAEIVVNESGSVTAARVVRSVPLLDEAALQAVKEWRYDPTIVNGKAVPVRMRVTVNFSLSK
jgi:TonB family protein